MGWTSYHATHYTKGGAIDKKTECDAYFTESLNNGHYKVEKSAMVDGVYYAAIRPLKKCVGNTYEDLPAEEQHVFGVVFLTDTDKNDYYNFSYKDMDESMGPGYYDCPESILKLLSPTENKYALEWREKCHLQNEKQKLLKECPVGTSVTFLRGDGLVTAIKCDPAYQFKKPWWYCEERNCFVSPKNIGDILAVDGKAWKENEKAEDEIER